MFSVFPVIFDPATGTLSVVTADPKDSDTLRNIESISGAKSVKAILARHRAVLAAIARAHAGDLQAFARLEMEAQANMHGLVDMRAVPETRARPRPTPPQLDRPPPPPVPVRPKKPPEVPKPIPRQELDNPFDAPPPRSKSSPAFTESYDRSDLGSLGPPPMPAGAAGSPPVQVIPPAPVPVPVAVAVPDRSADYTLDELIDLLNVIISLLENTRADLRGHSAHVARLVRRGVERMNLGPQVLGALVVAAYTHDLGKMGQFHLTALNSSEYDGHKLAAQWLRLSAEAGDRIGQRNYAALHFRGDGVEQDYARAMELYRAAAEQGDGPAQDMLSWMLLEGEVAEPDYVAAKRWAEAAAAQGVAPSMTRLGLLFHNALGVERDPAQAVMWWRRGAERGDADGQAMLGAAYHLGSGVVRDTVEAYVWLLRARAGGSPLAMQFFMSVRAALSPDDAALAERRVAEPLAEPAP